MAGLCCFLGFVFILILIILISYWLCYSRDYPKIKYRDFRKYYVMNPERWYCGHSYVSYRLSNGESEEFCFRFVGFYLYKLRNHLIKMAMRRKEYAECVRRMMDDINNSMEEQDDRR